MSLADDVESGRRRIPAADTGTVHAATLPPASQERILRLMSYLAEELSTSVSFVGQAAGSSHEGWIFTIGEVPGGKVVVRLEPDEGPFLDYDDEREVRLLRRLAEHGFPVPRVLARGGPELVGSRFVVLEWIEGDVLNPRDAAAMPELERRRRAVAMAQMLARLHSAPWPTLAGPELAQAGAAPADGLHSILEVFSRGLAQLRVVNSLVLDFVRVWLERHAHDRTAHQSVVHGDFRLGNLVWNGEAIIGILDWETGRVGDPLFDIAWMCMGATRGSDPIMGLVSRDEFVAMYAEASGTEISRSDLLFWQIVAAWVRGCTETRLLDIALVSHGPADRDARDLSWEFGSTRTEQELFLLIDSYEGSR